MAPIAITPDAKDEPMATANVLKLIQNEDAQTIDLFLRQFRCLIADLCQQFNGGHPGGAMGMAGIGLALWKYVMKYSPSNPNYFNRDRFVLSNGHTCLFHSSPITLPATTRSPLDTPRLSMRASR
ncbi:hypothetical protein NM208_g12227 [Fusarium decemcellulare]|uniref:Uncharacterized protein n=1 Tax=Fusarium decemcellulare TaxID=57161 RepID=A0ACC1RPF2_9HYPO|nr:hypothetical protein NM208_g12227 [Fusarium decemcellulare]